VFDPCVQVRLRYAAMAVGRRPAIYVRRPPGSQDLAKELGVSVLEWGQISRMKGRSGHGRRAEAGERVCSNFNPDPHPAYTGSRATSRGRGRTLRCCCRAARVRARCAIAIFLN